MFQIHEIYRPTKPLRKITGPVRIIDSIDLESVVLIDMDAENQTVPFPFKYTDWVDLLNDRSLEKAPDPFLRLTSAPTGLPKGVANRLKDVIKATSTLSQKPELLHAPRTLAKEIKVVAKSMNLSQRTVKRWVLDWLQAGRNPAAVVRGFIETDDEESEAGAQTMGAKRGVGNTKPETASDAPAHEIREKCEKAYASYVKGQRMIWLDAYYEMLIVLCGIPDAELKDSKRGLLMDPVLIEKYRPPTWPQCRYVFRKLKKRSLCVLSRAIRPTSARAFCYPPKAFCRASERASLTPTWTTSTFTTRGSFTKKMRAIPAPKKRCWSLEVVCR